MKIKQGAIKKITRGQKRTRMNVFVCVCVHAGAHVSMYVYLI